MESKNEYDETKDSRQKSLMQQYEEFLLLLKVKVSQRDAEECQKAAWKNGEVDEIDEKVCLKRRAKATNHLIMSLLPEITQHAHNYEQCLQECSRNHIAYVVANHSCRAVYEKNFHVSTRAIAERLLGPLPPL